MARGFNLSAMGRCVGWANKIGVNNQGSKQILTDNRKIAVQHISPAHLVHSK